MFTKLYWIDGPWRGALGNIIPASRLSPIAQNILKYYSLPTVPGTADGTNNLPLPNATEAAAYFTVTGRIDHNFGEKERIYGRYIWNSQTLHQNSNGLPGYGADLREGVKGNNGFLFDSLTVLSANTTFDMILASQVAF